MKSLLTLGLMTFAMTFCGLSERIKQMQGGGASGTNSSSNTAASKPVEAGAETPHLTAEQQAIQDKATETKWDEQGIRWKLPAGWRKVDLKKESGYFSGGTGISLLPTISVLSDDFPDDISLKATYDSALTQMKNGKYESVRYAEIDGVRGVEWVESMPEDKDGARRHQWIGFRHYLGQNQQLNIMLAGQGNNFDKHRDEFAAIMYSMKIDK
ncbi:MAG TPA: hypothetical protein VGQ55_16840 [Pyrinomonadaceae bacterium]|jgi:hypothetical protein|nr:hypothetical protein [Pyrinomonadaceae bacterium]